MENTIKPQRNLSRRRFLSGLSAVMVGGVTGGEARTQELNSLNFVDANILARMLRSREVTAVEVMEFFLDQIERLNPLVNAIPTLRPRHELLAEARNADSLLNKGRVPGLLHGFPFAVKDLALTRGIRTTFGSPIYKNFVPETDELFVERLKKAGAIIIGKTNTPEFGAGSQTYNEVFGVTRNPYDLSKTCGGSSGGAAVALACGMVPLADGSDLGGSLRNPASFCNVVGFRPSPGRIPRLAARAWNTLPVQGPMARTVPDVALLMSVMAGPDFRDPISLLEPGDGFLSPLARDFQGTTIAWSENLGLYSVEPVVNEVCNASRSTFEDLGCRTENGEPDFSGADKIFQTLRAASYASNFRDEYKQHRGLLKDTVVWNIEQGLNLTSQDIAEAEARRTELYRRVASFLEKYDFLVLPVSQVAPFSVEIDWIREINGIPMETYIDWMATCYAITCTGLPAISVPCGFTPDGLPIGLQIVGRRHRDFEVLQLAYAFEQATGYARQQPGITQNA